jgi:hypothetical protein
MASESKFFRPERTERPNPVSDSWSWVAFFAIDAEVRLPLIWGLFRTISSPEGALRQ